MEINEPLPLSSPLSLSSYSDSASSFSFTRKTLFEKKEDVLFSKTSLCERCIFVGRYVYKHTDKHKHESEVYELFICKYSAGITTIWSKRKRDLIEECEVLSDFSFRTHQSLIEALKRGIERGIINWDNVEKSIKIKLSLLGIKTT